MGKSGREILRPGLFSLCRAAIILAALSAGAGAGVIDNMDDATLWAEKATDGSATLTVSTAAGNTGNAVKGTYDLKTGGYVLFGRKIGTVDISSGDAITFLYKGTGSKNNIEVKMQDDGGDWFSATLTNVSDTPDWTRAVLTYKGTSPNFAFAFMEGTSGDSKFASTALKKVSIGVTKSAGGSGSLLIDDFGVYQKTADSIVIDVDNYNDGAEPNILGFSSGAYIDPTGSSITTSFDALAENQPDTGARSLKIAFTRSAVTTKSAWVVNIGTSGTDMSTCTEIVFDIRGSQGGESLAIGLKNSVEKLVLLNTYLTGGVKTAWQRVRIPFTAFSGVNAASIKGLSVWFQATTDQGVTMATPTADSIAIWIDNIHAFKSPVAAAVLKTLDSFEAPVSISGWTSATGDNASLVVERATGVAGKAFQLTYVFNSGSYAIIERKMSVNVLEGSSFKFLLNGTGASNNLEFKVKDGDGTVYLKILSAVTNTNGVWTPYTIPYTSLVFSGAGSDNSLNLADIAEINFAITRAGSSTSGVLSVDELSFEAAQSFNSSFPASGPLENLAVTGNPVSPNGDGVDDEVKFTYTLRENSAVAINIYDLQGNVIRAINGGLQAAGAQTMSWDVRDRSGRQVRNGLCIFRLDAKSVAGGGRSDIRNVIAVVR